jgi:light-regulated signal transduction histidine kinase (bacteriophytochrome)
MLDVIQSRERELKEHQDNLEKTVDERTRKLKIANQELEAFSYSVSHDLKAPLRALDGFSQAIIEDYGDQLDPLGQNYLNRIRSASQRMEKLIESMLYLSRIGRQNINIKEVNISHISYRVLSLLHEGDPNRDIHTEVEPDIIVDADQALIEIVLNNLIGNAWKYTLKTEKPEIEIRKEQDYFYVRDNGAGFDMTYANKLFGAFQRLHKDQEFEGTGIGLATVARIVHRHGGEIWANAEPDKGATFYIRLPKQ